MGCREPAICPTPLHSCFYLTSARRRRFPLLDEEVQAHQCLSDSLVRLVDRYPPAPGWVGCRGGEGWGYSPSGPLPALASGRRTAVWPQVPSTFAARPMVTGPYELWANILIQLCLSGSVASAASTLKMVADQIFDSISLTET